MNKIKYDIKFKKLETFYIVTKIKEHKKIKNKLLSLIKEIPKNKYQEISHTDWTLPKEYKREYLDLFYKTISPYMDKLQLLLKEKRWSIHNGWFQQYYKNDSHDWHRHYAANFTNVYYLELPKKTMTTHVKKSMDDKRIQKIQASEGDLITFPASILHRSEKVNDNVRKTIISFNSDFHE